MKMRQSGFFLSRLAFLREWLASLPLALHRDQPPARTASPSEYLRHVSLAAARHPSGSGEAALYFAAESHRARLFQQLANDRPALRLGLRLVKGLSEAGAQRLVEARRAGPFIDVQDVLQRAGLSKGDLERLAAAGALAGLAGHRHLARWQALGARRESGLLEHMPITEGQPMLRPPTEGEDIVEDYTSLGLTLGRHPLALLRDRLKKLRYRDSRAIERLPHGRPARVAGLVITRQRPATASGVIFLTLEDEHGTINVVVWRDLADRAHAAVTGGRLLGVTGSIEKAEGVIHIVAAKIEDHTPLLGRLVTQSHDFH